MHCEIEKRLEAHTVSANSVAGPSTFFKAGFITRCERCPIKKRSYDRSYVHHIAEHYSQALEVKNKGNDAFKRKDFPAAIGEFSLGWCVFGFGFCLFVCFFCCCNVFLLFFFFSSLFTC